MKTLLLVRHAKSSHANRQQTDHDRPLNERGEREAPQIGLHLKHAGLVPDWVLSSTAVRARETARHLADMCGLGHIVDIRRELYLAAPDSFVRVLRTLPSTPVRVAVVAHNPGLEEFLAQLTDDYRSLGTSAVAEIQVELDDWAEFLPGTRGRLKSLWRAKDEE